MQLNSNGSNQAESVEVFTSSSNEGRGAIQNSSIFVGRAIQNSNYEGAASNSDSASWNINRIGMNVNRASTNLSSVGNFSAGATGRLMTEIGKMDDDAIKLTLAS